MINKYTKLIKKFSGTVVILMLALGMLHASVMAMNTATDSGGEAEEKEAKSSLEALIELNKDADLGKKVGELIEENIFSVTPEDSLRSFPLLENDKEASKIIEKIELQMKKQEGVEKALELLGTTDNGEIAETEMKSTTINHSDRPSSGKFMLINDTESLNDPIGRFEEIIGAKNYPGSEFKLFSTVTSGKNSVHLIEQYVNSIPLEDGISKMIVNENNQLIAVENNAQNIDSRNEANITANYAERKAKNYVYWTTGKDKILTVSPSYIHGKLAYKVVLASNNPHGTWTAFVNGKDGSLIDYYNAISLADSAVTTNMETNDNSTTDIMKSIEKATSYFTGLGAKIGKKSLEVNVDSELVSEALKGCGSWYDAEKHSIEFGNGRCGKNEYHVTSDIVFHEFTHSIIYNIYYLKNRQGSESGAINEALADYFAASMNNDPVFGEGAISFVRNLKNSLTKENDWKGNMHFDSQIFSGALWDIREALGQEKTDKLIFDTLSLHPNTFEDFLVSLIITDDNNSDLSDGTPNQELILKSFAQHGIYLPSRNLSGEVRPVTHIEQCVGEECIMHDETLSTNNNGLCFPSTQATNMASISGLKVGETITVTVDDAGAINSSATYTIILADTTSASTLASNLATFLTGAIGAPMTFTPVGTNMVIAYPITGVAPCTSTVFYNDFGSAAPYYLYDYYQDIFDLPSLEPSVITPEPKQSGGLEIDLTGRGTLGPRDRTSPLDIPLIPLPRIPEEPDAEIEISTNGSGMILLNPNQSTQTVPADQLSGRSPGELAPFGPGSRFPGPGQSGRGPSTQHKTITCDQDPARECSPGEVQSTGKFSTRECGPDCKWRPFTALGGACPPDDHDPIIECMGNPGKILKSFVTQLGQEVHEVCKNECETEFVTFLVPGDRLKKTQEKFTSFSEAIYGNEYGNAPEKPFEGKEFPTLNANTIDRDGNVIPFARVTMANVNNLGFADSETDGYDDESPVDTDMFVRPVSSVPVCGSATAEILINASTPGWLYGFGDFNNNGKFDDNVICNGVSRSEQYMKKPVEAGNYVMEIPVLGGITPGEVQYRFFLTGIELASDKGDGTGNVGEIEDYLITNTGSIPSGGGITIGTTDVTHGVLGEAGGSTIVISFVDPAPRYRGYLTGDFGASRGINGIESFNAVSDLKAIFERENGTIHGVSPEELFRSELVNPITMSGSWLDRLMQFLIEHWEEIALFFIFGLFLYISIRKLLPSGKEVVKAVKTTVEKLS